MHQSEIAKNLLENKTCETCKSMIYIFLKKHCKYKHDLKKIITCKFWAENDK